MSTCMLRDVLRILVPIAVACGVVSAAVSAQDKTIVLRAARIFDGRDLRAPGLVVISGSVITSAGTTVQIPVGAQVIDLGDATLSPGFIDAHTHLSSMYRTDFRDGIVDSVTKPVSERTLMAVDNLKKTLMAGVTTARDLGSRDFMDVGLRNAAAAGIVLGPRMLVSVHAISSTGGHCDDQNGRSAGIFGYESGPEQGVINGPEEGRKAVRYNVKYGADVIKVCATGGILSLTDPPDIPQLTQEELNAIVDEAHTLRKKTAAHAHGSEGAKRAIRAGIDSIEHGTFLDDEALDLMKARGTYFIPTLEAAEGGKETLAKGGFSPFVAEKMKAAIESGSDVVRKAVAKGVKIGVGTDAGVYPHGRNIEELHLLTALGLSPVDALRAATSIDAELLGIQDRVGILAPGKRADIIAFPGDPRQNIREVEKVFFVMKDGLIVRNDQSSR